MDLRHTSDLTANSGLLNEPPIGYRIRIFNRAVIYPKVEGTQGPPNNSPSLSLTISLFPTLNLSLPNDQARLCNVPTTCLGFCTSVTLLQQRIFEVCSHIPPLSRFLSPR